MPPSPLRSLPNPRGERNPPPPLALVRGSSGNFGARRRSRSESAFRGESKLSTWIYRIAINLSKNRGKYLRARHVEAHDAIDAIDRGAAAAEAARRGAAPAARPDDAMAGAEVERVVRRAILELEPSFHECLVLRDVEDLSYAEIGEVTGLAEGTVKSRIHRARAQLRERVERALGAKIA